jgi:hypothetical protein
VPAGQPLEFLRRRGCDCVHCATALAGGLFAEVGSLDGVDIGVGGIRPTTALSPSFRQIN